MTFEKVERRLPFYQGKVAAAGAAVAVFYWFAETGAHAWIFRTGSYAHELFHLGSNELWMRSFTCCLFLVSAFVLQGYLHRIRRTEERTRLLARAVEQAGEAILITNAAGFIQYVNPAFEQVTGYAAREVLGERPSVLKSGASGEAVYKALWQTIESGEVWKGQTTVPMSRPSSTASPAPARRRCKISRPSRTTLRADTRDAPIDMGQQRFQPIVRWPSSCRFPGHLVQDSVPFLFAVS